MIAKSYLNSCSPVSRVKVTQSSVHEIKLNMMDERPLRRQAD